MSITPALQSSLPSGVTIQYSRDSGTTWNDISTTPVRIPDNILMFKTSLKNVYIVAWNGFSVAAPPSSETGFITLTGDTIIGGTISLKNSIYINDITEFMSMYNFMKKVGTPTYTGTITLMNHIDLDGQAFEDLGDSSGYF